MINPKSVLGICVALFLISCTAPELKNEAATFHLSVSSSVDQDSEFNQQLIEHASKFLRSKNEQLSENKYWSQEDFDNYYYPYSDIYKVEQKDSIANFYQPTLMDIVETDEKEKKLLKLAFIGHDAETEESDIKIIYNIVASKTESGIIFSRPLNYRTREWPQFQVGNINYFVSPQKEFNREEAQLQLKDNQKICDFYDIEPLAITYYSCVGLPELFRIKGFDYNSTMYIEGGGGLAEYGDLVFSANGTEVYTHEIIHLYHKELFPDMLQLLDEGMATYVGGSRALEYSWHKENLRQYIDSHSEVDFSEHLEPYERFFAGDTSIPYMVGALICERTYRLYGKPHLINLLYGGTDFWAVLAEVGLTKENLDAELKKELLLTPILCM